MFSQRNNPYCELLQISAAKIQLFSETARFSDFFVTLKPKKSIKQFRS